MSEVFYRKYRPNVFGKVVGQKTAISLLTKMCQKETFHHAYLMVGSSGSGKTTSARILASAVNCEKREKGSPDPCGTCSACQAIKMDAAIDVHELDGASDGGKEEIGKIIEAGLFAPNQLKKKVFIIDEAHQLSSAAMTSLLKPTEEPNPSIMYILCTSEYSKIPDAVSSRCCRINFMPIEDEVVSGYISSLAKHLKIECEPDVFRHIAAVSGGNMRTALNYFQSVHLVSDEGLITGKFVADYFGLVGRDVLYELASAIAERQCGRALDIAASITATNADCNLVAKQLSDIFRNVALSGAKVANLPMSDAEREKTEKIAKSLSILRASSFVDYFARFSYAMSVNLNNKWVLESLVAQLSECKSD